MSRERILVTGDTGSGKTRLLFEVAVEALKKGHNVFFQSLDGGHLRFLPKVKEWDGSQFHVFDCPNWSSARQAYKDMKPLWQPGDWGMQDRVDMIWDFVREYWATVKFGVSDDDLDEYFAQKRLRSLEDAKKMSEQDAARIRNAITVEDLSTMDWDIIKGMLRSIVFDPTGGPDARMLQINVIATELALPGISSFTSRDRESESSKLDPRKIREHSYTLQGEKTVKSWYDTVLLLKYGQKGYTVSTLGKDRERPGMFEEVIQEGIGFLGTYQSIIEEEIVS